MACSCEAFVLKEGIAWKKLGRDVSKSKGVRNSASYYTNHAQLDGSVVAVAAVMAALTVAASTL